MGQIIWLFGLERFDIITIMQPHPSIRVGVIADDLTSATDGAAPFLLKGYAPLISRGAYDFEQRAIVSIDTNSRASILRDAVSVTATAVAALADRAILFKTIDSTLRGHIREEISAAFRASGRSRLVVAPSFPDAGRLTIGGIQFVNGVPVSDSNYGRDPVHPAGTSCIADLIDPSLGEPVILAQDGTNDIGHHGARARTMILDADSQPALNRQLARLPDPEHVLWVGSPGLAIALASRVAAASSRWPETGGTGKRSLIVVGSANPISHAQCRALWAQGVRVVTDIADAPREASILCLQAPLRRCEDSTAVLADLAGQSAEALTRHDYDVVIATGGETMAAILDRIGIVSFTLVGELEPGFPVGRAQRSDGTPLTIAMKAGGFGSPATLVRAAGALLGEPLSPKALIDAR
jgi:uncharacterized protein YgbK (DUF1537 family)